MNENSPAFPVPSGALQTGVCFRDWMAAVALQGLTAKGIEVTADRFMTMKEREEELAVRAYGLADAMLAVRRRQAAADTASAAASSR